MRKNGGAVSMGKRGVSLGLNFVSNYVKMSYALQQGGERVFERIKELKRK